MTEEQSTQELREQDLDHVLGGATKGLVGDDIGILRGSRIDRPDPKQMERAFDEDE